MPINIILEITPLPWKAPYVGTRGAFSPRYNESKIIKKMIREKYTGEAILGQIRVDFNFFMPIPKSASKKAQKLMLSNIARPQSGGDVTNLRKFFEDLMQDIVYANDRQIVAGSSEKWYAEKPSVHISIMEL